MRRFAHQTYWGRPIPSFGDSSGRLLIIGLAPAAHGGNRTGRMFTGDRSGDWLFDALYNFGFANQPTSSSVQDGLVLNDCYITAALRCAPPQNKPTAEERNSCFEFLIKEIEFLKKVVVIVALGKIAFDTTIKAFQRTARSSFSKQPKFGHANEFSLNEQLTLIASYHPSQQNTFTGKLTKPMFDQVFQRVRLILDQAG